MNIRSMRVTLDDSDMRRAIRVELRRPEPDSRKIGPMLELYCSTNCFAPLLDSLHSAASTGVAYSERRAFLPNFNRLSSSLDALLLDIFREEFQTMDTRFKQSLFDAISRKIRPSPKTIIDELRDSLAGGKGCEPASGFKLLEMQDASVPKIRFFIDPYRYTDAFSFEARISEDSRGEMERLSVISPDPVYAPEMEFALIAFARLFGFSELSFRLVPMNGEKPYISLDDLSFARFSVLKHEPEILIGNILRIECFGGAVLTPSLSILKGGWFFSRERIASFGETSHDVPAQQLVLLAGAGL